MKFAITLNSTETVYNTRQIIVEAPDDCTSDELFRLGADFLNSLGYEEWDIDYTDDFYLLDEMEIQEIEGGDDADAILVRNETRHLMAEDD